MNDTTKSMRTLAYIHTYIHTYIMHILQTRYIQVYSPPVVTVRVWVYCAVTGSSKHSISSFSDSGGVSGPSDSGSRSSSGDTGEGEQIRVKGYV